MPVRALACFSGAAPAASISTLQNPLLGDRDRRRTEDLPSRIQERPQRGGLPPLLVPDHLSEDLEGLLPPQRSELAALKLYVHRHARQYRDAHTRCHALLDGLYALELHLLRGHHASHP